MGLIYNFAAGTKTCSISSIQTVVSPNQFIITCSGNTFALGDLVTITQMTTPANQFWNGSVCQVTATGTAFTCLNIQGNTITSNATVSDSGAVMVSLLHRLARYGQYIGGNCSIR